MKFGKEFASQMVPEWQEAYMDYNFLKTILKEILRFQQRTRLTAKPSGLNRKMTLYRAFSGLTQRNNSPISLGTDDIEEQVILMNPMRRDGTEGYETTFLKVSEEGGENELVYFRRLDDEFNKVLMFYKSKVEEVMKEADLLNRQMDAFIAFRITVERPQQNFDYSGELTRIASDVAVSVAALSVASPSGARASRRVHLDIIEEEEGLSTQEPSDDSVEEKSVKKVKSVSKNDQININKKENIKGYRPAPLQILNHVKMNNTRETPRSTIKGVLKVPNHTELKFSRENLKKVEEQLKRAFTEFYNKLRLLKSYSFVNILAFSKIMKKYDKITSRNVSKSYMKMVDNSYLDNSDELTKLMERVESTVVKHFCNSNRNKAMSTLKTKPKRERHSVTFSVGFLAGCTAALLVALVLIIRTQHILFQKAGPKYMETMFPLYSLFGFIVLHLLMYAANVYYWRRYRVNYSFIFGFKQGTELGYRPVLLVSFGFAVVALASVLANLDMEMGGHKDYKTIAELLPFGLLLLVFAVLLCPFNIIYRSSRHFLLTCAFHFICAPLYKVTLPDFFLADQLTSQVQAIRSLEFYVCYYNWGNLKKGQNSCTENGVYYAFYFIIAALPYWSRLLQCLRRLYEEKDFMQGLNALKYFLTIVAVSFRTAFGMNYVYGWKIAAGISSSIAAIFSTYWDLVIDWGLLQKTSKNRWLRDKLLVSNKSVYFAAMVLNVLLRFAWLQAVLEFDFTFLHKETLITIVASLEIIRRGIWNFFRLENEHLNNVGKYRAFKSVPLPFNYEEDGAKD